jgi:hypothetical protein
VASTFIPVGALGDDFICIKQRDYLMHGPPPHERKRGELRLIKQLDLYRDDAEKELCRSAWPSSPRSYAPTGTGTAAWPEKQKAPPNVRYWG